MNTGNWLNNNNSSDLIINKDLEGYNPPYKSEPPTDRNWVMEPNILKPYSTIKHTGGLILSWIIMFIFFEIYQFILYIFDLIKDFIMR